MLKFRATSRALSTTATITATTTIPPAKDLRVELVHPRTVFSREMNRLRKQYAAEHRQRLEQQRKADVSLKQQEAAAQAARAAEILAFKATRDYENSMLDGTVIGSTSLIDIPTNIAEEQVATTFAETTTKPSRRNDWESYITARRKTRFRSHLHTMAAQSARRSEALLHLHHEAADFITYANLDDVLNDKFRNQQLGIGVDSFYTDVDNVYGRLIRSEWSEEKKIALERREREDRIVRAVEGFEGGVGEEVEDEDRYSWSAGAQKGRRVRRSVLEVGLMKEKLENRK
ncbi:hypothetical protein HK096_010014 [Nowakowskiella sp. JEL0078]|nr:hypothetical protein HK096_010014 [Nowakowskiella sp. JEL0078]